MDVQKGVDKIETMQRRFMRQLLGFKNLSYHDHLIKLGINRLEQ